MAKPNIGGLIDLKAEGMEEAQKLMKKLTALGATTVAVELNTRSRTDGVDVMKIIEGLHDTGRKFTVVDEKLANDVGTEFVDVAMTMLADKKSNAKNIANRAFLQCMNVALKEFAKRLETNKGVPGGVKPIPPDSAYAAYKIKKHGSLDPVGIATKELLAQLAPDSANVNLKKS